MLRRWILSSVFIYLAFVLTSCQTNMLNQFGKITPGMEKDDVLNLMGSPDQTWRFHGKDRWWYTIYSDRIRFDKEVQFFEGNVIYIGDHWEPAPELSAVAMDKKHDEQNRVADELFQKEIIQHRQDYLNYEAQTRGQDKVRYVPQFSPIQ
jgi:outer membrane protein assembly factor BamE